MGRIAYVLSWIGIIVRIPEPDHSPDPGAGFTPDFLILAGFQQVMDQFL